MKGLECCQKRLFNKREQVPVEAQAKLMKGERRSSAKVGEKKCESGGK